MNYLKYIELAAENLQFFLWYKDYVKRFGALAQSEKDLSPEWTVKQAEAEALAAQSQPRPRNRLTPETAAVFRDFESHPKISESERSNPFHTPPRTPSGESSRDGDRFGDQSTSASKLSYARKAGAAFDDAGLKWQPCELYCTPVYHFQR